MADISEFIIKGIVNRTAIIGALKASTVVKLATYEAENYGGLYKEGVDPKELTFDELRTYAFTALSKALKNRCCWYGELASVDLGDDVFCDLSNRWRKENYIEG